MEIGSGSCQDQQALPEAMCVPTEFHESVLDDALELEAPDSDDESAETSTNTVIFKPSDPVSSEARDVNLEPKQTDVHDVLDPDKPNSVPTNDGDRPRTSRRSSETSLFSHSTENGDSKGSVSHRRRQWGSQTMDRKKTSAPCISSDSLEKLVPTLTLPSDQKQRHRSTTLKTEASKVSTERTKKSPTGMDPEIVVPINGAAESQANVTCTLDEKHELSSTKSDSNSDETTHSNVPVLDDSKKPENNVSTGSNVVTQKKASPAKRKAPKETKAVGYLIEAPERIEPCAPAKHRPTNIVYIRSLVRPFTAEQLRQMISEQFGPVTDLWLDRIKSSSLVKLDSEETAIRCREGLDGSRWPSMNPRTLRCDFGNDDLFAWMQEHGNSGEHAPPKYLVLGEQPPTAAPEPEDLATVPLRAGKRSEADSKTRPDTKPSDRGSTKAERGAPNASSRSLQAENKDREAPDVKRRCEEPAKLLDDLFRKTTCTPCIYWLPLTTEQAEKQAAERAKLLQTNPSSTTRPLARPIAAGPAQRATRSPFTNPTGPERPLSDAAVSDKPTKKPVQSRSSPSIKKRSSSLTRSGPIEGVSHLETKEKPSAPDRPGQSALSPIPTNVPGGQSRTRSDSSSGSRHRRDRRRKQSSISPARESAMLKARERPPTQSVSKSGYSDSRRRVSSSRSPPRPRAARRSTSSRSRSRSSSSPYHNKARRNYTSGLPSKPAFYRSRGRLRSRSPRGRKSPVRSRR